MNQLREWVLRQLRLGRLQELFSMLLAIASIYAFSAICVYFVHDSFLKGSSLTQTISLIIIYAVGGFVLSLALSSNMSILFFNMPTVITDCIRFDYAKDFLSLNSDMELIEFAKSNRINIYFADSKIERGTSKMMPGKIDTMFFSYLNLHIITKFRVNRLKAFFDREEFDSVVEKYTRSFQVRDPNNQSNQLKSLEKTVSDLLEDKTREIAKLAKTEAQLRAANAQTAKAWKSKWLERSLRTIAIRVAVRLGKLHEGEQVFTKSQVQAVLDDILAYENESCDLSIDAANVPKGFAGQIFAVLPPTMRKGRGRQKNTNF